MHTGGKSQESYKLDAIANVELGERKLSYDEYDSLHNLYQENYQKFIDYNIKDVDLLLKLEDKLKLIEMAITLGLIQSPTLKMYLHKLECGTL